MDVKLIKPTIKGRGLLQHFTETEREGKTFMDRKSAEECADDWENMHIERESLLETRSRKLFSEILRQSFLEKSRGEI